MQPQYRHLVDLNDYPIYGWNKIIKLAQDIMRYPDRYRSSLQGKIMATLFYEPSTRTQMSFQSAMLRLGGGIIGFDNPATSSVAKGENLKDTTKIISSYADVLVIRHPQEGSAKGAAISADCPIINAGDGGHLHPTQTLTDLLTLREEKGKLTDLVIGICGDLKNGRTVHSLVKALACHDGNRFVFISTEHLRMPDYIKSTLTAKGCSYTEVFSLEEALPELEVLYMTRIQKERFPSLEEYETQKAVYQLNQEKMDLAKPDMIVLHPLPRVDEICVEVDSDPRALYFKQALYGMYVRMALIFTVLDTHTPIMPLFSGEECSERKCSNKNCITNTEYYLPKMFTCENGIFICEYCDTRHIDR